MTKGIARGARLALWIGLGVLLSPAPAFAMHWVIYAPDEAGYRYWLDTDSIVTKGDYIYAYYVFGDLNSGAPQTTSDPIIGINCASGDSVQLQDGEWKPGNHFTDAAYLFKSLCQQAPPDTGQK